MPELPEVETVVRGLRPAVVGQTIVGCEVRSELIVRHCSLDLARLLPGRQIVGVERRGKFIIFQLNRGRLLIHLGMTGRLRLHSAESIHTRAILQLERARLIYDDPRMFGSIELCEGAEDRTSGLGPEPLDVTPQELWMRLQRYRAPLKSLLLNQRFLRGVGNIYADEALFRAGIRPQTPARRISRLRAERLCRALQQVLQEAIAAGGSSISDYVDASGRPGWFQFAHRVYGRAGEPCLQCGSLIRRTVLAGRSSHYCPRCQR